jgi:hypothetical protein
MPTPQQVIDPITIDNYGRMAWENILESYPTANQFFKKGNITRDCHGNQLTWPIEAGRNDVYITQDYEDVTTNYQMTRAYAQPSIDWAQLAVFKAISKGQLKRNNGKEALVQWSKKAIPAMYRDGLNGPTLSLFDQFFNMNIQSYTTKVAFAGLPSVFTGNAAITWSSTAKEGTINNTNYAGLSCVLSGITTVDNVEADAWTPTAVNTTSTAWAGGSGNATFQYNAFEILTYGISAASRFSPTDESQNPDEVVLTRAMYNSVAYQMQQKQSFLLTKGVGKGASFGIGMDVAKGLEHNGVPIRWDGHLATSTGYILNYSQMWLDFLPKMEFSGDSVGELKRSGDDESIFETEIRYNDGRRALTVSATTDGQFRINPRNQVMLYAGA